MRFTISAVLALGSTVRNGDAFVSPTLKMRTAELHMDKSFTDALAAPNDNEENGEDDGQGSSRFREMMKLAQQEEQAESASSAMQGRAIDNPFLNSPIPAPTQLPSNPDELSVEEQARMFREMMAGNTASQAPPPPVRVAREDRAGRPQGRNPDADKIANASDLYLAQLKRDSSVRTLGRIRGDDEVSEAVFEDEGIKVLDGLLKANPYLQG
jgi:hypothetical protein